jgi:hypothetical protein
MNEANHRAGCGLVVDAGFSFTHAVSVFDWHVIPVGIKRINLGGKALTNYMKELVSYRYGTASRLGSGRAAGCWKRSACAQGFPSPGKKNINIPLSVCSTT